MPLTAAPATPLLLFSNCLVVCGGIELVLCFENEEMVGKAMKPCWQLAMEMRRTYLGEETGVAGGARSGGGDTEHGGGCECGYYFG